MNNGLPEITLKSGHVIKARSLEIHLTYGGLFEGMPNESHNKLKLDKLKNAFGEKPVVVIPPEVERREDEYPKRSGYKVEFLPPLQCEALFSSVPISPDNDRSELVIVWFQHTAWPFIEDSIRVQIENLNWEHYAKDWSF